MAPRGTEVYYKKKASSLGLSQVPKAFYHDSCTYVMKEKKRWFNFLMRTTMVGLSSPLEPSFSSSTFSTTRLDVCAMLSHFSLGAYFFLFLPIRVMLIGISIWSASPFHVKESEGWISASHSTAISAASRQHRIRIDVSGKSTTREALVI